MRLRPNAFPTIRLSQFARLIHNSAGLFSQCMEAGTLSDYVEILRVISSSYWNNHYTFGKVTEGKKKLLGENAIKTIILNTIVPFMFTYGKVRGNEVLKDKSLNLLEELPPESNSIVKGFESIGIKADNSFFSQALVQLKNQYCDKRKCLFCQIGTSVLLKKVEKT